MEKNVPVNMKRPHLDDLPVFDPPDEYLLSWYATGDVETWVAVQQQAENYLTISRHLFSSEFGDREDELGRRQCFLWTREGAPVATATGWFTGDDPSSPAGRVHWVAVVPDHQGRGLGKAVLSIICRRMKQLGHTSAWLGTHTRRIPAINLYLSFGFVPDIRSEKEAVAWRELKPHLNYPVHL